MKTRIDWMQLMIGFLLLALQTSCATPAEETPMNEAIPVTTLEQIIGTWEGQTFPGTNFYISIQSDGTLKLAGSLENLKQGRTDTYQIWFENDQMMFHIPVFCQIDGSYQAVILSNGNLKFSTVEDPCDYRISRFDRSLPGAMEEYVVEFMFLE